MGDLPCWATARLSGTRPGLQGQRFTRTQRPSLPKVAIRRPSETDAGAGSFMELVTGLSLKFTRNRDLRRRPFAPARSLRLNQASIGQGVGASGMRTSSSSLIRASPDQQLPQATRTLAQCAQSTGKLSPERRLLKIRRILSCSTDFVERRIGLIVGWIVIHFSNMMTWLFLIGVPLLVGLWAQMRVSSAFGRWKQIAATSE